MTMGIEKRVQLLEQKDLNNENERLEFRDTEISMNDKRRRNITVGEKSHELFLTSSSITLPRRMWQKKGEG